MDKILIILLGGVGPGDVLYFYFFIVLILCTTAGIFWGVPLCTIYASFAVLHPSFSLLAHAFFALRTLLTPSLVSVFRPRLSPPLPAECLPGVRATLSHLTPAAQVMSGSSLHLPRTNSPIHLRLCICCVSMYAAFPHAYFVTRASCLFVLFIMVIHAC